MIRKSFITSVAAIIFSFAGVYGAEVADTLLNVKKASHISVTSGGGYTSITVRGVDGTPDNYYYQSHSRRPTPKGSTATSVSCSDVTDICVINSAERVSLSYVSPDGDVQRYAFGFGDPENRSFKSFIGKNSSDFGLTIKRSSYLQWDVVFGGVMFGFMSPVNSKPSLGTSTWKSIEYGVANLVALRMRHGANSLSLGMGFEWQDYVNTSDRYFHRNSDGKIGFESYPEGSDHHRSRIGLYGLQFPLLYGLEFGHKRNFAVQFGPILNVTTGGGIKTQYKLNGSRYSIDTEKRLARPVTVDLMGAIYYKHVGLFCRYAPMKKLKTETGIDFNTVSFGIIIGR